MENLREILAEILDSGEGEDRPWLSLVDLQDVYEEFTFHLNNKNIAISRSVTKYQEKNTTS